MWEPSAIHQPLRLQYFKTTGLTDRHMIDRLDGYVQTLFGFENCQDLEANFKNTCYGHWHLVCRHERRSLEEIFRPYLDYPLTTSTESTRGPGNHEHRLLTELDEFAFAMHAVRHQLSETCAAAYWGLSYVSSIRYGILSYHCLRRNYAGILLNNLLPIISVFWASDYYRPRHPQEIWDQFTPDHFKQVAAAPLGFVAAQDNFEIPTVEGRDFVFRHACYSSKQEASTLKIASMTSLSIGNDCSLRLLLWHSWIYPGGASEAVTVDSFKESRLYRLVYEKVIQRDLRWYNIRDLGFTRTAFNPNICLDCSNLPNKEGRRSATDVAFAQVL